MIRYGILGFGHHAAKRLVKGFHGSSESSLIALWRRDAAKGQENAREFAIPYVFDSAEALCASPEIDAIFVASPDALHLEHVLLAARHRKHVLCEKPLAMSAPEAEQMLAAAANAGVRFGVAQNMRYNASLQLIRQWIADGRIGPPTLAHSQFSYSAAGSLRQWIYDPELACGGPIGDVGIHCIDALRYVLDADVAAVATLAHSDAESGAVESHAVVALDFTSGAMGAVTLTTRSSYRSVVEVTGRTGVILCENGLTVDHPVEAVLRRGEQVLIAERISNDAAYSRMLDAFSRWIETGEPYLAPAQDGLRNQRILDAAYRSWRSGRKQTL
jgi:predicted dehydrogenase